MIIIPLIIDIAAFFEISTRDNNDEYNKKRESIIGSLINNEIPGEYYQKDKRWKSIKKSLFDSIYTSFGISSSDTIKFIAKAGRKNNYDFDLQINGLKHKMEFKYNICTINEAPQFVSLPKPSQYFDACFEKYFYDNFLNKIAESGNLEMMDEDIYTTTNCNNKVKCLKKFKELYDTDPKFKNICKKHDKEGIKKYLLESSLKLETLSNKLIDTQKNKKYICFKDGKFNIKGVDSNQYRLKEVIKKNNTNVICKTESGINLEIRLRFKNGCGLQFPALQIKRKIPTVPELKEIAKKNNIKLPSRCKKIFITDKLDQNNIIY